MRKLFDTGRLFLRGGSAPAHVAAAVLLGLLAGATLGANASLAAVLLTALAFNVSTRALLTAGAAAAAIRLAAEPRLADLGRWLLERTPLGEWLGAGGESLTLALFDLDRYALVGGVAVALVAGVPLAWLAGAVVRIVGRRLAAQAAAAKKKSLPPSRALLALHWLVAGRAAAPAAAVRVGRPLGLTVAIATVVPLAGLLWHFGPELFERALLDRLSRLNRAEVTAADVRLSLADGLLEIDDLRIAHPEQLDQDRWRAGYVTALVRLGPLVRGRLEIDKLLVEDASCNVARDRRARRCDLDFAEPATADSQAATSGAIDSTAGTEVQGYVRGWEEIQASLGRFHELLSTLERVASAEDPALAAEKRTHCDFGRPRPAVWIHAARVQGLPAAWSLGEDATLDVVELATDAHAGGRTPRVEIAAPDRGLALSAALHREAGAARRHVTFAAVNRDLASLFVTENATTGTTLYAGTADISADGWIDEAKVELPVRIALRNLDVEVSGDRSPAGVTADVWNDGLYQMAALEMQALLIGDWRTAKLTLDERQLVSDYRRQLLARGDLEMVACIDRQQAAAAPSSEAVANASPIKRADLAATETSPAADRVAAAEESLTTADEARDVTHVADAHNEPETAPATETAGLAAEELTAAGKLAADDQALPDSADMADSAAPAARHSEARPAAGQLRYPRNVAGLTPRHTASSNAPRAPRPADIARVAHTAPLAEAVLATERSLPESPASVPAGTGDVDELVASVEEREPPQAAARTATAVDRTPSSRPRLPAPIGLELGYDEQSVDGAAVASTPSRRQWDRTVDPVERGERPRPQPTMGQLAERQPLEEVDGALEDSEEQLSRLRRWSGEVAGGMRRLLPDFGRDEEASPADGERLAGTPGAERATERAENAPPEDVVPRDPAMARRMAQREAPPRRGQRRAAPAVESNSAAGPTPDDAPWYQFWR